jgi:hypothetical protein
MSSAPTLLPVGTRLTGRTIAVSVSPSDDLPQMGLPSDHLSRTLHALLAPLVSDGARIAYGGRIQTDGDNYTLLISQHLGEMYRRLDQTPGSRPFVHFVAQIRVADTPVPQLFEHLQKMAPYGEIWVTTEKGVALTLAASVPGSDEVAACVGCGMASAEHIQTGHGPWGLARLPLFESLMAQPAPPPGLSFTSMRRHMAELCDARVMVGGRKTDFSGEISGLCEEALLTIAARRPLFLLGGGGGASRDISAALGLLDDDLCVPRSPQPDEGRYAAGLRQLQEARSAFESLFPPHVMPALRDLAVTESLMDAPELMVRLLAQTLGPR